MLNEKKAKRLVKAYAPGVKVVDAFPYKNLYLVRVEHASKEEANYDPFYSVNQATGEVREFSVLTDGNPMEIAQAFEKSKGRRKP